MLFDRLIYQSPGVQHINALPARSTFFSFADEAEALAAAGSAEHGKRCIALDGQWNFCYTEEPDKLTVNDLIGELAGSNPITVPGCWTTQGYDKPHYTNVQMPYANIPPEVPECNPTGIYQRTFELTAEQLQTRLVLHFDGVESYFAILVNDKFAGAAKDSRAAREFDITNFCHAGTNRLTVVVCKWSGSNYIEDQDMWWHGGIVRSVYLLTLPKNHLADIFAVSTLDETYKNGKLELKGALHLSAKPQNTDDWKILFKLYDPAGKLVKNFAHELKICPYSADANYMPSVPFHGELPPVDIPDVQAWSAENPALYKLSAALIDPAGNAVDHTAVRIGFRSLKISERKLLINGEPVLICGVNRHESHPRKGRSVNREDIERDLKLMKQFNINAIRTSHYPDCPEFCDLCDEYGFYVWDEANLEHHAYYFSFCSNPAWSGSFVDRAADLLERDKNHPSVVVWSLGNESGAGANHAAMAGYIRFRDPSRILHYEGAINSMSYQTLPLRNTFLTDIVAPMYPPVSKLYEWSRIARHDQRPYIMCEFSHAMGNSNGELADYFEAFEKCDGIQGGFIWEWCDHALYHKTADGKEFLAYGGDFGDTPNDGNFVCDGLVGAERDVHPGLYEYKYFAQAVKFHAVNLAQGLFEVENRRYFSDLSDLCLKVAYSIDGKKIAAKNIRMPEVAKQYKATALLKLQYPDFRKYSGKKVFVTIEAVLKNSCRWAEKGFSTAHEQFQLPVTLSEKKQVVKSCKTALEETDKEFILQADSLKMFINKVSGMISLERNGNKLSENVAECCFFRAPVDNDGFRLPWLNNTYRPLKQWLDKQYNNFVTRSVEVKQVGNSVKMLRQMGTNALPNLISVEQIFTPQQNGSIKFQAALTVPEGFDDLPRIGFCWQLQKDFKLVEYLGMGPLENYRDRQSCALYGRYTQKIAEMPGNYLMPQSAGNRTGVEEFTLQADSEMLKITSAMPIEFSILPYSNAELSKALHWHELPQQEYWYLYTDIAQRGVGTRSCGPELAEKYRIQPGNYQFDINIF